MNVSVPVDMNVHCAKDNDVLCRRGKKDVNHPGNLRFCALIKEHLPLYNSLPKTAKRSLLNRVYDDIALNGNFVEMSNGQWTEVGHKSALHKIAQAFRSARHASSKLLSQKIGVHQTSSDPTVRNHALSLISSALQKANFDATLTSAIIGTVKQQLQSCSQSITAALDEGNQTSKINSNPFCKVRVKKENHPDKMGDVPVKKETHSDNTFAAYGPLPPFTSTTTTAVVNGNQSVRGNRPVHPSLKGNSRPFIVDQGCDDSYSWEDLESRPLPNKGLFQILSNYAFHNYNIFRLEYFGSRSNGCTKVYKCRGCPTSIPYWSITLKLIPGTDKQWQLQKTYYNPKTGRTSTVGTNAKLLTTNLPCSCKHFEKGKITDQTYFGIPFVKELTHLHHNSPTTHIDELISAQFDKIDILEENLPLAQHWKNAINQHKTLYNKHHLKREYKLLPSYL